MRAAAEKEHAIGNSVGYAVPRPHGMLYLQAVKLTPHCWLELNMQLCNVFASSTSVPLRIGVQYVLTFGWQQQWGSLNCIPTPNSLAAGEHVLRVLTSPGNKQ
jgi:hypothetical protein